MKDWLYLTRTLINVANSFEEYEPDIDLSQHLVVLIRSSKLLVESMFGGRPIDYLINRLVEVWELTFQNNRAERFFESAFHYFDRVLEDTNLLTDRSFKGSILKE